METTLTTRHDRDYSPNGPPVRYPDPDVVVLDSRFAALRVANTSIKRLHTGTLWAEGPAWCGGGRYLVWSDIPNNIQLRWLDESGHVSIFRHPSGNSNGNTFDYQGRQLSCEHLNRRVVRYEHDGSVTVLADSFEGKPLNSPNDIVVHPNGSVWFTDPPYGTRAPGGYEGTPGGEMFLKNAVYRVDPVTSAVEKLVDEIEMPNGLCFNRDYSRMYIVNTGSPHDMRVYEVVDGAKLTNGRIFSDLKFGDRQVGSDGVRVDIFDNLWASAVGGPGIDGVQVFASEGERIGQILLPERCANIAFGGAKRNRLFMAASQSLYALYVNTRGAHIA
jgi:gluconolactonase